jgi:hypothetical protein
LSEMGVPLASDADFGRMTGNSDATYRAEAARLREELAQIENQSIAAAFRRPRVFQSQVQ